MPKVNIGKTARILLNKESLILPKMMIELVGLMDRKNRVYLNAQLKRNITKKYAMKSLIYLDVSIKRFTEQNYIIRIGESSFMVNPHIAFKCSNQEFFMLLDIYSTKKNEVEKNRLKIENEKLKEKIEGIKIINKINDILGN